MGFQFKSWVGVLAGVLLWGCSGPRAEAGDPGITVLVNDSVHLDRRILAEAEKEAHRIFHAAEIEIAWVNCIGSKEVGRCRVVPGPNEFVLHIVKSGKTSSDSVFGEAFLAADGTGKYCDVFWERIERGSQETDFDVERLLGSVIAHEVGHLLLGSRAHSTWGIMMPTWRRSELQEARMGALLFHPEQVQFMKARIRGALKVANLGSSDRGDYWSDFWASSMRGRRASTETPSVPPVKPSM